MLGLIGRIFFTRRERVYICMSIVLEAKKRSNELQSQITDLRAEGDIPAVVYGYKTENTPIAINGAEFLKVMREVGRNGVIALSVNGNKFNTVLHEYQKDPLRNEIIHADFLAVDMNQENEANVRVEFSEEAAGVKSGGILQPILHELSVTAKPDDIPESIQVDVTNLQIAETITVGHIRGNYSCTINHEDEDSIVTILTPRVVEEEEEEDTDSAE